MTLRIVVTGAGVIAPNGTGIEEFWDTLVAGRTAIKHDGNGTDDNARYPVARVAGFHPEDHFDARRIPLLDRASQFAIIAAREAVTRSGIEFDRQDPSQTAVIVGTGIGGIGTTDAAFKGIYGPENTRPHPMTVPKLMANAPASCITIEHALTGPCFAVSSACASTNHAIAIAVLLMRGGVARRAVVGGAEASITYGALRVWKPLRVMAKDTCRPFSSARSGMVLGEGAGIFVIERLDDARERGAPILAEIAGVGMSADAKAIVLPTEAGAARAISLALEDGGIAPESVDHVNAHGTGTIVNDAIETRALHRALGGQARNITITSTKAVHGHALGAAGALELCAVLGTLRDGVIPPTANFIEPAPDCDLDCVHGDARRMAVRTALSNSFGFGGLNAVLALRKMG